MSVPIRNSPDPGVFTNCSPIAGFHRPVRVGSVLGKPSIALAALAFQQDLQIPHGIAQVRRISWVRGVGRPGVVSGLLV